MKIGVLALQGDVHEHQKLLKKLGVEAVQVKSPEDLDGLKGLVLPGGESTTISRLLVLSGLDKAIIQKVHSQEMGILGTCAGAILLAKVIEGGAVCALNLMDIKVRRNAFGRQRESFEEILTGEGRLSDLHAVFIRAPLVTSWSEEVEPLLRYDDGCVLARQGKCLASCFHPELAGEERVHQLFLELL